MAKEIERKFLLPKFPTKEELGKILAHMTIQQSYLVNSPEVRIRQNSVHFADPDLIDHEPVLLEEVGKEVFLMTIKGEGDLSRDEVEFPITEDVYFDIRAMIGHNPIIKDYHRCLINRQVTEFSIVDPGTATEFIYMEAEFRNEDLARAYICPFDGAIDVTHDSSFKMKNYWKRTRLGL